MKIFEATMKEHVVYYLHNFARSDAPASWHIGHITKCLACRMAEEYYE